MKSEVILLRTHYFDVDLTKFCNSLRDESGREIIVVCDETRSPVRVPQEFRKVSITLDLLKELGLYVAKDFGWRCGDYFYYAAKHFFPDFANYWLIEGDVRIKFDDMSLFFDGFPAGDEIDLIAPDFRMVKETAWGWPRSISWFFPNVYTCFFPLTRLSASAIDYLSRERAKFSSTYEGLLKSGQIDTEFPNDEHFISSALMSGGFSCRHMNEFGRIYYTKDSFHFERPLSLKRISSCKNNNILYHPVLSRERFNAKIQKDFARRIRQMSTSDHIRRVFPDEAIEDLALECGEDEAAKFKDSLQNVINERKATFEGLLSDILPIAQAIHINNVSFLKGWLYKDNVVVLDYSVNKINVAFDIIKYDGNSDWQVEIICRSPEYVNFLQKLEFPFLEKNRLKVGVFPVSSDSIKPDSKIIVNACFDVLKSFASLSDNASS